MIIVMLFMAFSIFIAVTAWMAAGWSAGLSALGTSVLALAAGSGLKAALKGPYLKYKAGAVIFAAVIMALAWWLSQWFSLQYFGSHFSGATWAVVGFVVTFLFTPNRMLAVPE